MKDKFEMPEWAKAGPVDLRNFAWRAWNHAHERDAARGGAHPIVDPQSPDWPMWLQYFYRHLGGLPLCARLVIEHKTQSMTMPEPIPQWFDPSFTPDPNWKVPEYQPDQRAQHRPIECANVLIRTENPLYAGMLERTKRAHWREWREDQNGRGIWVSLKWLPEHVRGTGALKRMSVDEVHNLRQKIRDEDAQRADTAA